MPGSTSGVLVPACGGTEQPFMVNGRRWLYCWEKGGDRHCYLDLDNDVPVWHRSFHPAFAPEFEHELEVTPPKPSPSIAALPEVEDFYW